MENESIKCSYKEHNKINAIYYCHDCKLYLCNKCIEYFHSKFLHNHNLYKIDNDNQDIFTGYCKENNHLEILKFFCKTHNILCCSSCLCQIKNNKYGQHSNCDVCIINDIKGEKKNKLKENMKQLKDLSNNKYDSINNLKILYEKINEKKEESKLKIQRIFTKIRNVINNREDELLLRIDQIYDNIYFKEELVKESEKLEKEIKMFLEKDKILYTEWDNDNKLNIIINDCIKIEKIINNINIINENIKKANNNIVNIIFNPIEEGNQMKIFLETINKFGRINYNIFNKSKIIDNDDYMISLNNWINPNNENLKFELLYRLSTNGDTFSKFHELCDNKGPTLTLFHINDGNKVGVYTPLSFDTTSIWKKDKETFIFNLNKNKRYKKLTNESSIYCRNDYGIYTESLGQWLYCGTMKKIVHLSNIIDSFYENGSEILPSNGEQKYYDLCELEVFKISILDN